MVGTYSLYAYRRAKLKKLIDLGSVSKDSLKEAKVSNMNIRKQNNIIFQANVADLEVTVLSSIQSFVVRYGHKPTVVIVRYDEIGDAEFPLDVEIVDKNLPPAHFKLGPIIFRKPRIVKERIPCNLRK